MRKSIVLLLLSSLFSLTTYSQSTNVYPLKETDLKRINRALAEGLEAKELLAEKDHQLVVCDNVTDLLNQKISNLQVVKDTLSASLTAMTGQVVVMTQKSNELEHINDRQKRKLNRLRKITIVESTAIIVAAALLLLL